MYTCVYISENALVRVFLKTLQECNRFGFVFEKTREKIKKKMAKTLNNKKSATLSLSGKIKRSSREEERGRERNVYRPPIYIQRQRDGRKEKKKEKRKIYYHNGDATRPRRTVQRVVPQKRQPIVLRLQHGEPEMDVEKFLRVYMPRLLGDPSIVGRAHHGGEKREHGSMDRGRAGFV